jgi:catechol 2,3-dioxygenase-like lactoylglutathione lyase family enzyme
MTTTETSAPGTPVRPALNAIHHLGLTVTDVRASAAWYERVLGLQPMFEERHYRSDRGGYTVVLGPPDLSFSIGVDHHPANSGESFDETRTGLDHVSFTVASVDELQAWARHLDSEGVAHSGVYQMEGFPIALITFRDPDGIQLELLAFQH